MEICSDRELKNKLDALYRESDALDLSDWERNFVNDLAERDQKSFTPKQGDIIVKLYDNFF